MNPDLYHDLTSAIKALQLEVCYAKWQRKNLLAEELDCKLKELIVIYRELYELYTRELVVKRLEEETV